MEQSRFSSLGRRISDKYNTVNTLLSYGMMPPGETRRFHFGLKGNRINIIAVIPLTVPNGRTLKVTFDTGGAFRSKPFDTRGDEAYIILEQPNSDTEGTL